MFMGLLVLGLASCTNDPVGRTSPVKGMVKGPDGQALKMGSVTFWPDKAKGNKSAFEAGSEIKEDGTYELFTHGKKGVPPGLYIVTIISQTVPDSTQPTKSKNLVPEKYNSKEKTDLFVEVKDDSNVTYDLTAK